MKLNLFGFIVRVSVSDDLVEKSDHFFFFLISQRAEPVRTAFPAQVFDLRGACLPFFRQENKR